MKKLCSMALVGAGIFCFHQDVAAQMLKKIGRKIERRTEQAVDKALDAAADELDGEEPESQSPTTKSPASSHANGPFENLPAMGYDFKPGTEIVFVDDFEGATPGAMAPRWTSNGTGATATVEGFDGKWLRLYHENTYKIKELVRIPENFTLEFDLLTLADNKDGMAIDFGFDHQKGVGQHYYLASRNPVNVELAYRFDQITFTSHEVDPTKKSEIDADMSYFVNDVMKVKVRVVGDRMAVYINQYKVLDTEMVDPVTKKYFYIAVENEKNQAEIYVDNVKITKI